MSTVSLNVTAAVPEELRACLVLLRHRQPLMERLGGYAERALREHFRKRNLEPNKSGFRKSDWWASVRTATAFTAADQDNATVTIAHRQFPLRLFGGVVRPSQMKNMAIPVNPAAAGKWPSEYPDGELFPLISKKGERFLAKKGAGKNAKAVLYFRLTPKAVHKPDPRALPDMQKLEADLAAEAGHILANPPK